MASNTFKQMASVSYKRLQDKTLSDIERSGKTPNLLLHVCCAPCASHVLRLLSDYFNTTVLFYNPNINALEEFTRRKNEVFKLLEIERYKNPVSFLDCGYNCRVFDAETVRYAAEPEGGTRCGLCFTLRLEETAKRAKDAGFDYFATTLTVSPHKNARVINETGLMLAQKYGTEFLCSDFKKQDGYKRSVEISNTLGLYRQTYCGCRYSLRD